MKCVKTIQLFVSIWYRAINNMTTRVVLKEEMTLSYLGYYVLLEENQRRTAAYFVSKRLNLPEAIDVGPVSVGLLTVIGF